jgi:GNAT superfamily N-acetyltransferase
MTEITLRDADGEDLQDILQIGHRTWRENYAPLGGEDFVEMGLAKWWTADAIIPAIRSGRVIVAELDGKVVGMTAYGISGSELTVWKLYVLPQVQSRGVGSRLLQAAIDVAEHDERVTEVRSAYLDGADGAQRFFTAHGFVEFDRESTGAGIPDSIWMRLTASSRGEDRL